MKRGIIFVVSCLVVILFISGCYNSQFSREASNFVKGDILDRNILSKEDKYNVKPFPISRSCDGFDVCLAINADNGVENNFDIEITTNVELAAYSIYLDGMTLDGAQANTGGLAGAHGWLQSTSTLNENAFHKIIGFDMTDNFILADETGVLTTVAYTDPGNEICFGYDNGVDGFQIGIISDSIGVATIVDWGDCYCVSEEYDECGVCGGDGSTCATYHSCSVSDSYDANPMYQRGFCNLAGQPAAEACLTGGPGTAECDTQLTRGGFFTGGGGDGIPTICVPQPCPHEENCLCDSYPNCNIMGGGYSDEGTCIAEDYCYWSADGEQCYSGHGFISGGNQQCYWGGQGLHTYKDRCVQCINDVDCQDLIDNLWIDAGKNHCQRGSGPPKCV